MGYVLPITHYQYIDYQNRVIKDKQDPYFIEKPYKIIFDVKHQDIPDKNNYQDSIDSDQQFQVTPTEKLQAEKLYASLTGKGKHFSESI